MNKKKSIKIVYTLSATFVTDVLISVNIRSDKGQRCTEGLHARRPIYAEMDYGLAISHSEERSKTFKKRNNNLAGVNLIIKKRAGRISYIEKKM
jgi:hypothetical protein